MNIYQLSEAQIVFFALILLRVISFTFSAAILSAPFINVPTRILIALSLTMCLFATVPVVGSLERFQNADFLIPYAVNEIIAGLILGFVTRLFFFGVGMVGELSSMTMGLNSAQMFNPMSGGQAGVLEQFYVLLATLFFLAINGHHILIAGLTQSLSVFPVGELTIRTGGLAEVAYWGREIFVLAIRLTAPIIITILISNIVMGIIGRAIPQMNVLVTSFPITLLLGVGAMMICLPLFITEVNIYLDQTTTKLMQVMKSF